MDSKLQQIRDKIRIIFSDLSAVSLRTAKERKQFIEGLKIKLEEICGVEKFYYAVLLMAAAFVLGYIILRVTT